MLVLAQAPLSLTCAGMRAQYDDVWERRDVLGVHAQKQEGFSWVGACVPTGRIFPQDFYDFADVAEKCAHLCWPPQGSPPT